jgi:hypothetical protein
MCDNREEGWVIKGGFGSWNIAMIQTKGGGFISFFLMNKASGTF